MDILANTATNWLVEFWGQFFWPLIQFLIGLGVIVFVHELGHYLCARWAGIKVERFALGFGPRLIGFKRGGTDYCFCAIPVGGYVKMLGQEDFKPLDKDNAIDPRSFNAASVGKRLVVISAGVVMNIILSAVLFIIICMIGMKFDAPVVGETVANFPASKTKINWSVQPDATTPKESIGLKPGDRFLTIDG
ncbi:MAG: site-2 protease family protein, partial [Candidatus Hydrogenedentes bacterium]|nr:site-2 protease family protein [Candidatus Hydrogenedentota bacterium]